MIKYKKYFDVLLKVGLIKEVKNERKVCGNKN